MAALNTPCHCPAVWALDRWVLAYLCLQYCLLPVLGVLGPLSCCESPVAAPRLTVHRLRPCGQ